MKARVLIMILLIFGSLLNVAAQTATIETITNATVGVTVAVPFTLTDFELLVSGYQFTIDYDTAVLTYVSTTNFNPSSGIMINVHPSGIKTKIAILCSPPPGSSFDTPRTIFKQNYTVKKACQGNISWSNTPVARKIFDDNSEQYVVNWVNGAVKCSPGFGTITQPTCTLPTGSVIINNLPATGTWTLTRTPGGVTSTGTGTSTPITGLAPGTYSWVYTDSKGCTSSPSANLVINASPAPAAPLGEAIQYFNSGATVASLAASGTAIQWYANSTGGTALATNVPLLDNTHYYASQTIAGCESSARLNVTVFLDVPANITVAGSVGSGATPCYNASQTITFAGGANVFTVQPGGSVTLIAGQVIKMLTGTEVKLNGYMHGYISSTERCGFKDGSIAAVNTGDEAPPDISPNSIFTIYPNPSAGNFTLEQRMGETYGNITIEIIGMHGERLKAEQISGMRKHEIKLSNPREGICFLKVVADDHVELFKLLITR